jgi:hypothetical protein
MRELLLPGAVSQHRPDFRSAILCALENYVPSIG